MKRLPFKPEFVPKVLDGTKVNTARWGKPKYKVGDICAATCRQEINGKMRPVHLVPASLGFATVEILSSQEINWNSFTDEMAALCGVTRRWYVDRWNGEKTITLYGFRKVDPC